MLPLAGFSGVLIILVDVINKCSLEEINSLIKVFTILRRSSQITGMLYCNGQKTCLFGMGKISFDDTCLRSLSND